MQHYYEILTGGKYMENSQNEVLTAQEVSELLKCSINRAYVLLRTLNNELKKKGYLVTRGRIPKSYLEKRCLPKE